MMDRLSHRRLNRATLHRQLLLQRAPRPARDAIGHLAGLQAQAPLAPYVGLWTRLAGFGPADLEDLLTERTVVRAHLMRNTVHLVTASDYLSFRPLFQPLMDRALAGNFGRHLGGVDLTELREAARTVLAGHPLTRTQLAARLSARWPDRDPASLAYAATHLLHLVQVPPRGLWGQSGQATWLLAATWLNTPAPAPAPASDPAPAPDPARAPDPAPDPAAALEQIVLRYLTAYGPASVNDIQAWSGLSRLREVTDRLGARLRPFTGPDGMELLDLPDAPRPDENVPAPPRFLPEYDNLLLSFADRSRVIRHGRPVPLPPGNGATTGTLLIDGLWEAGWTITRNRGRAALEIRPFRPLGQPEQDAITAEGSRLLEFAAPAAPAAPAASEAPAARDVRVINTVS
jgi:Winged helix DNA-binding domain